MRGLTSIDLASVTRGVIGCLDPGQSAFGMRTGDLLHVKVLSCHIVLG
jgi:hypothetical protein